MVGSFRLRSLNIFGFGCQHQCSLEKNQQVCCHLELQKGRGSFISNTKCGLKFGFIASQTDWLKKKEKKRLLLTYIFTGHTGKILNRKKKSAEVVDLPKTALPKVQT